MNEEKKWKSREEQLMVVPFFFTFDSIFGTDPDFGLESIIPQI